MGMTSRWAFSGQSYQYLIMVSSPMGARDVPHRGFAGWGRRR